MIALFGIGIAIGNRLGDFDSPPKMPTADSDSDTDSDFNPKRSMIGGLSNVAPYVYTWRSRY